MCTYSDSGTDSYSEYIVWPRYAVLVTGSADGLDLDKVKNANLSVQNCIWRGILGPVADSHLHETRS